MKYQVFDWENAVGERSGTHLELLKATYKRELTEAEFIEIYRKHYPGRVGLSRPKSMYKNLKTRFGFFTGDLDPQA